MTKGNAERADQGTVSLQRTPFAQPFALRKDMAAAALGISPSLFVRWITEGKMPKGRKIGGVVLWDFCELRDAWNDLRDADGRHDDGDDDEDNPFDGVVA